MIASYTRLVSQGVPLFLVGAAVARAHAAHAGPMLHELCNCRRNRSRWG